MPLISSGTLTKHTSHSMCTVRMWRTVSLNVFYTTIYADPLIQSGNINKLENWCHLYPFIRFICLVSMDWISPGHVATTQWAFSSSLFRPVPCQEKMADWQWCVPTWPFHTRAMMNAVGRQNRTWQQWSDHLVVDSGCIGFDWAPDWKVNAKVGAIYYIYRPAFAEKIRRLSS